MAAAARIVKALKHAAATVRESGWEMGERFVAIVAIAFGALACSSIPEGRSAVDAVDIVGNQSVSAGELSDKLATAASPKLVGLFRGIAYDYEIFDASALQRDLARIERYYRGHGFFEAHARAARVVRVTLDHVRVQIVVDEGPPMLGRRLRIEGLDGLPQAISDDVWLAAVKALPEGRRFDEDAYKKAQVAVARALTDNGYAHATVESHAQADLSTHSIDYAFTTRPGEPAVFGAITIEGLDPDGAGPRPQEIGEAPLRRAIAIEPGMPYSTTAIDTATQALLDLEVFTAVQVIPALSDPSARVISLDVKVEPTKLRVIKVGGGAEFDEIKTEAHALVGWEDHNFFGGLRDFSVDFTPGGVFYPLRINNIQRVTNVLPEERLRAQFLQPGFLEPHTRLFVKPEFNVYPLLVETTPPPGAPVVGYVEPKGTVGLDRRFGKHLLVSLGHNVQGEIPFSYTSEQLNPAPPQVILSFPELVTKLDFRDDPVHPHAGIFAVNDLQVAGGPFGGSAEDVRIQPDVRGYLPIGRHVTLAVRGSLGFLFPIASARSSSAKTSAGACGSGYGDYVRYHLTDATCTNSLTETPPNQTASPEDQQALNQADRDVETVYFRGFFLGGPDSNRGFPLRGIAPHGIVPFLNPATASTQVQLCDVNGKSYNPAACSSPIPIGGFTLWQASVELRFDIPGPVDAAAFCDSGDVSQTVGLSGLRATYLHMSCGVGARYDTPVGPIRLDIGYRIPFLQVLGRANEQEVFNSDSTQGCPPRLFASGSAPCSTGIPAAMAFGIGEAF
ncbi:MAG: BamA/TamA family outer membrane protein [Polyangiaceae bacterium]